MHISMSDRWRAWSERQEKSGHGGLPNLGFGGTIVAVIVSSFFAAMIADTLFVMVAFGPHAFFVDGLRVADWKHGVLSTGAKLPFVSDLGRGLLTMLSWLLLIGVSEFSAGLLTAFLAHRPRWMSAIARLLGGSLLFVFVGWFWLPSPLFHPIPLAASIGGVVLIWKGVTSVFGSKQRTDG
jgi:hypothetical protein